MISIRFCTRTSLYTTRSPAPRSLIFKNPDRLVLFLFPKSFHSLMGKIQIPDPPAPV